MDDMQFSAVLCAIAVFVMLLAGMGPGQPMNAEFALALFAASFAGYFAIAALMKAGVSKNMAIGGYAAAVLLAYIAVALSFGALSLILRLAFLPFALCVPAIGMAVRETVSG